MTEYKIVMTGAAGVGKSALTIQMIQSHFLEEYDPTIEDSYRKRCTIDDETCLLDILDTAHQPEYTAMREGYVRTAQVFIAVYSITARSSFEEIDGFIGSAERQRSDMEDSLPVVLCANKNDLEEYRQVSNEEGKEKAERFGAPFVAASAKTRVNVEEAFFEAVRVVRKRGVGRVSQRRVRRSCALL
uniref:Small monomeric GTPase n=1 Tax=Paramoeba aestuarina TaxID=180227 RepID=A0A7S4JV90_9EUKA|mmetsp:Transcript_1333/g.2106  ORF Transcript_1333/g.2106 Transcript_1333/m.2106 type:complete len:187 (+) Transcript_1333:56-616(+)